MYFDVNVSQLDKILMYILIKFSTILFLIVFHTLLHYQKQKEIAHPNKPFFKRKHKLPRVPPRRLIYICPFIKAPSTLTRVP